MRENVFNEVHTAISKEKLIKLGIGSKDIVEINGQWPVTIVLFKIGSNTLERFFGKLFDLFLPTRPVTLREISGENVRTTFHYRSGMVGFNPPNEYWTVEWEGTIEGVSILIEPEIMNCAAKSLLDEELCIQTWRLALSDHAPAIAYLGLDIASQAAAGFPAGKGHVEMQIQTLLAMIIMRYSSTQARDTALVGMFSRQVLKAVKFIKSHFGDEIDVQKICDISGTSLVHLNRLFRAELGDSVWVYVKRHRLNFAAQQLKTSCMPVSHIAKLCGMPSRQSFAIQFKREFGATPTEFRKACNIINER